MLVVEKLSAEPLSVSLVDPFVIATGRVDATRSVLVRATLRDDRGERFDGLGEGSCLPPVTREDQPDALAAVKAAAASLTGSKVNPAALESINAPLDEAFAGFPVARSAVEMAILDAVGKAEAKPVHALLSGRSFTAGIVTDITLPILAPERMAALAREWWDKGFRHFKVKVGRAMAEDEAALTAIQKAVPNGRLRLDANAGYSAAQAVRFLEHARTLRLHVECFEQPCGKDDLRGLGAVKRATDIPVIADESVKTLEELHALLQADAATGINLKLAKSGGLLRAYELGRAAQERGLLLMVGGMVETRLGMTAAAHLVAALGGVAFADLDTAWLLAHDPFAGGYVEKGPAYTLSERPGLDVQLR